VSLSASGRSAWKKARAAWPGPDLSTSLEWAARAGYAARGFVYLSIGALAFLSAIELARSPLGSKGAVDALKTWPLGQVWIAAIACGLLGFALWRLLQSAFDADRQGRKPLALIGRAGQALSGLVYGSLAWSLFELLDEVEDIGEADEAQSAHQMTAEAMSLPFGQALVLLVGGFVLVCGVANIVQGFRKDFGKRLGCSKATRAWACWLGRLGYGARGVAFVPLGLFILRAGWTLQAGAARNLGGALQALEAQPFGSAILAATGAGLVAFGAFALAEARWRRIDADPA
jgi:hypothetical protein